MNRAEPPPAVGGALRSVRKRGLPGTLRVALVFVFLGWLLWRSQPTPVWVGVGAAFVAVGAWWRAWAAGHLVKSRELAVSGPYRYVQNPLYFGRFCLGTGFCLMARLPVAVQGRVVPLHWVALGLFWAVFLGYYIPRKRRVEGERLERIHGQVYTAWASMVPLLFPRWTPVGVQQQTWSWERFRELNEASTLAAVATLTLAFAFRAGVFGA